MALVLNQRIRLRNLWRGLLYLPWIAPTVVTALTWLWMFDAVKGVFNVMAIQWGMMSARDPVDWLGGANTAMFAVMTVNVWRGIPFFGISLYAGLQTIPQMLYEAAEVDGASAVQKFIYITVPSLKNVIIVTTLLSSIWTFNDFNIVYLMTRGGPERRNPDIRHPHLRDRFSRPALGRGGGRLHISAAGTGGGYRTAGALPAPRLRESCPGEWNWRGAAIEPRSVT